MLHLGYRVKDGFVMLRHLMGQVEAIHVALSAGAPMQAMPEVEAVVGVGLAGDRYFIGLGFYSARPTDPGAREVTLFEAEVLDRLSTEHGIALSVAEHRRNLTTRGVRLDGLLGQRFRVGEVLLEGVKDCPPCEARQMLLVLAPEQAMLSLSFTEIAELLISFGAMPRR